MSPSIKRVHHKAHTEVILELNGFPASVSPVSVQCSHVLSLLLRIQKDADHHINQTLDNIFEMCNEESSIDYSYF
jgi:hypothetical protein